ncbi:magnesium transporter [Vibrio alfacsensis]|uniref:magnesium transporter n=1 Tax=Vibrio alfacsensis TaxID=1074311 RepID=UPI002ADDC6DB|nr:magnesium transporter [Vibrio alfacsensis]WQE78206.1 magnesium transporter [Vibrio alfacsensis]
MTFISVPFPDHMTQSLYFQICESLSNDSSKKLHKLICQAESQQLASIFHKLTNEERITLWEMLTDVDSSLAANLLDHFSNSELVSLMSQLATNTTVCLFQYIHSADRRLLIKELPNDLQAQLRLSLPEAWENEERAALNYAAYSAGGICKNEVLKVGANATIDTLCTMLNTEERNLDRIEWRYVYVQDDNGHLIGGLKIRDVLTLPTAVPLIDHIDKSIPTILANSDLNTVKSALDTTLHSVIPVIDKLGFQIGVVGFKHLNEALYQRSKQQLLEQAGVFGGDEFRSMATIKRNLRRLAFLLPSVALSYAAVSIIAVYEPIIEQIAVLAAILPLVANLSGAAGNQAVAVSIRELSTGQISAKNLVYVVLKELPIGAINGLLIGAVLALLIFLTHGNEYTQLPIYIGLAYALSSTLAVMIGGALPLLLKRYKLDPAMLSSPVLTTLTDAISFFCVLYLAQTFLL